MVDQMKKWFLHNYKDEKTIMTLPLMASWNLKPATVVKIGNVLSSSQKLNKHLMKIPGENSSKCQTKRKLHKFPIHVHGKLTNTWWTFLKECETEWKLNCGVASLPLGESSRIVLFCQLLIGGQTWPSIIFILTKTCCETTRLYSQGKKDNKRRRERKI
jgi:hypothetical protein